MMSHPSERLTVVIPTRERPQHLARTLDYMVRCSFPFTVVVADSSDQSTQAHNSDTIARLSTSGLRLSHRLFDSKVPCLDKIALGLQAVETPYAVIGADDDAHMPRALEDAANFLAANPDYSVAHGSAALIYITTLNGTTRVRGLTTYLQRAIDSSSASRRLKFHLSTYSTTWYSVHRADALRANIARAVDLSLEGPFIELFTSCLSLVQGKMHKGNMLFIVREANPVGVGAASLDSFQWMTLPDWSRQYSLVREHLCKELAANDSEATSAHTQTVDDAFRHYMAARLHPYLACNQEPLEEFNLQTLCDPASPHYADLAPMLAAREAPLRGRDDDTADCHCATSSPDTRPAGQPRPGVLGARASTALG
jgi:glycosyltransferase domain-containing protein